MLFVAAGAEHRFEDFTQDFAAWVVFYGPEGGERGTTGEGVMSLRMRDECEGCGVALAAEGTAFICSYECTFCESCAVEMEHACPNCGGELVQRPKRNP